MNEDTRQNEHRLRRRPPPDPSWRYTSWPTEKEIEEAHGLRPPSSERGSFVPYAILIIVMNIVVALIFLSEYLSLFS